uniref:PCI domain-containing protein n=1 Tax=Heterosigma akashiwo TaxID=2829 RepID=A0A6V1ITC2_HETAK|mmetsp:Transcript_19737/g.30960  ORF Transcript_19737/g.30960 Transcript_19737/m.30960 type:complete len:450 (+) Transcript_19737:107-1456(+)|eukprot:CAMPEP_0194579726 /NCGR_PEP_ID=MMETSP0292-20121207/13716_1 /TAXON_ID=39354 /ORGANISM="Heterosigma akashiwo, Strain CCMP2393" /LENGTH=449 /DNA_ID=CAMNT_0039432813 /DNA_START=89 /DNA_END=1438 /DNA_ORIENTATION=+
MSDDEYEYEYGSEEEYQYGSDEDGDVQDDRIEIENAFYEGDDLRQDKPQQAIELLQKVVDLETAKGDEVKWRFKALAHLVALHFQLDQKDAAVAKYQELFKYLGDVTRNECTDAVNAILDAVSAATDLAFLTKMYELTLAALKRAANERMWFGTLCKLGRVHLQQEDYSGVQRVIDEAHRSCLLPDGSDDPAKGTSLLEVYALEIQLCTATRNAARMREVYPKTLNLNAAVADPRIMGVIREEGGKMHMAAGRWAEAYNEFYEGFRSHQEAGNARARDCLKYVVLANMLALSDINPFAAREAKVYQEDREITAMMALRQAYDANELAKFERTLREDRNRILDDPFIMSYIEPLRHKMREQVLISLVQPYNKVSMKFLSQELKMEGKEVEQLIVNMILDGRFEGKIDQINGVLVLGGQKQSIATKKYEALQRWSDALEGLRNALPQKIQV